MNINKKYHTLKQDLNDNGYRMIRTAQLKDLPEIVAIYNTSIPGRKVTADLKPVSVENRLSWFHDHHASRPLWIIEKNHEIAGWLSFQDFSGRCAYKSTAEISIYIKPDYHHQGMGQKLLQYAFNNCPSLEIKTILALIFGHNHPSIQFFKKNGFEQWGYLPGVANLDGISRDVAIYGLPC